MSELLWRLFELCNLHEITLTLSHTPGARLDRPDQMDTSMRMLKRTSEDMAM